MKRPIVQLLVVFILAILSNNINSQGFVWKAGYFGFFDNREYYNKYVIDQTLFGSRISGEAGYRFNERHAIMAGIDFLYEFGNKDNINTPDITAYYRGSNRLGELWLGAFPRYENIKMPLSLVTDTFQYYRPNVEGMLIRIHKDGFSQNAWIDWTGRQAENTRESFIIGLSGYFRNGIFTYAHHFVMSHLAHSLNDTIVEHIRDNGGYTIMPGIDLSAKTSLDTLVISVGYMGSYDRTRGEYPFRMAHGIIGELHLLYRKVGLSATIYRGESQVITTGDRFYQSDFYARIDPFIRVKTPNIESRLQWSFHFLPGMLDLSMSLLIRANIDGVFKGYHFN